MRAWQLLEMEVCRRQCGVRSGFIALGLGAGVKGSVRVQSAQRRSLPQPLPAPETVTWSVSEV